MNNFLVLFVALFAFQGCLAAPKPEDTNTIDELADSAKKFVGKLNEQLSSIDTKKVGETLNEQNSKVIEQLDLLITKIPANEEGVNKAIETARDNLKAAAAKFKDTIGTDANAKAEEYKTEFTKNVKIVNDQVAKLLKDHESDIAGAKKTVEDMTKSFFDKMIELGQTVQKIVKEEAEKHEKAQKTN